MTKLQLKNGDVVDALYVEQIGHGSGLLYYKGSLIVGHYYDGIYHEGNSLRISDIPIVKTEMIT